MPILTDPSPGLDQIPQRDWPPVAMTFHSFHIMVWLGGLFVVLTLIGMYFLWRGTIFEKRWLLWTFVLAVPLPYVANQLGWITAEVGRQPWVVYGLLRTSDALSKAVVANQVLGSIIMFIVIYALLFVVWVFVLDSKIKHGPDEIVTIPTGGRARRTARHRRSARAARAAPSLTETDNANGEGIAHMDLNILWFILLGVLLAGYAILDGFDLGVGIMHLAVKSDKERRILMNSIGPLWDGNEVWLVTFGGALFAAFPIAYATAFSGFYTAFMALLFALIFRAVSMDIPRQARLAVVARILGRVVLTRQRCGHTVVWRGGRQRDARHAHRRGHGISRGLPGSVASVRPACRRVCGGHIRHARVDLSLFEDGGRSAEAHSRVDVAHVWDFSRSVHPHDDLHPRRHAAGNPQFPRAPVGVGRRRAQRAGHRQHTAGDLPGRPGYAFLSSCATIAALTFLFGVALFPDLIHSSLNPDWSLTVYNAASSHKTLAIMAAVAALGMPFVLAYTSVVYWVFRGKVQLGTLSY